MNLLYVIPAVLVVALFAALAVHFHVTLADIRNKVVSLFHLHAAAAIASASAAGNGVTSVVVAPPSHGATPPANAGATGTQTGAVPGGDTPDSNGAIAIPGIAAKFAPGSRFLTVVSLPYVPAQSAASFCIAANCSDSAQSLRMGGLAMTTALAVIPNPPESAAVGGPKFHLAGQAPGEKQVTIPGVVSIPDTLTTMDAIVAYYAHQADYGTNTGSGAGFSPKH